MILDNVKKSVHIVELTVPFEGNIKERNTYKHNKYAHFLTDIKSHTIKLTPVEVGVRGYLTQENTKQLSTLHKLYCKKDVTTKTFLSNISALAITGSYYIYTARKQPTWSSPNLLSAQI